MIRDIGIALQAYLITQGVPLEVVYGPVPATTTWARERIVIEQTTERGKFGPVLSQHINPKHRRTFAIPYKITIYARSNKAGAQTFEHNRRATNLLETVTVGLDHVAASLLHRANGWTPGSPALVVPDDLAKSETAGGAVYELPFTFDRPMVQRTFVGEIQPEVTFSLVSMAGTPDLTFTNVGATGDTITRSAGSWITDGFTVGVAVRVRGSASNNVTGTIAALSATVLTFAATALVNEGPVSGCAVNSGGGTSTTTRVALSGAAETDTHETV